MMELWKGLFPDKILTINYEDLVADQERETRKILEFIDLDWQKDCLEFYKQGRSARTASNFQVRRPIYNKSVSRWKKYEKYFSQALAELN